MNVKILAESQTAYNLMHKGALCFSGMTDWGIRVDEDYCKRIDKHLSKKIIEQEHKVRSSSEIKAWKEKYGDKTNLNSHQQMADILFNELDYQPVMTTEKGNPSTSAEALDLMNVNFASAMRQLNKYKKTKNNFLKNIMQEAVNGRIHPFFNLHTTVTYRSSSSRLNFQNIPKRDRYISMLLRKAFRPSKDRLFLEFDFKGAEVSVGCCEHKDPTMIQEVIDPTLDMHRDAACNLFFMKDKNQITSSIRYLAKNGFVFPEFYGDYWLRCAENIWKMMLEQSLKFVDGKLLKDHLEENGIVSCEDFMEHVERCEDVFWKQKYKVYDKWKKKAWRSYQKKGKVELLSGFVCKGILDTKQVSNYRIQGPAFHCLLQAIIFVSKELKVNRLKSKLCGQIHDSMLIDTVPDEKAKVIKVVKEAIQKVQEMWDWVIVPLVIEAEESKINGSWYRMDEIEI